MDIKKDIVILLPYLLSFITIYMTILAGNKSKMAWLWGLLNQLLWLIWIYLSQSYGLIFMNVALWILYFRNYLKWNTQ